jgi:S-adenosyl-L-methionine hydrolase (adenosine-forming)
MPRPAAPIALVTDYGLQDPYVGVMKGAILSVHPAAVIVDLCHGIPAQDVAAGRRVLASSAPYFPEGTVFVGVVDPGVGTARAALAVESRGRIFIGPDNGLLDLPSPDRIVRLEDPRWFRPTVSRTFHGRDLFGPVAAHVAKGLDLDRLGTRQKDLVRLQIRGTTVRRGGLEGRVVSIDRFGNLITDLDAADVPDPPRVRLGRWTIRGWTPTYGSAKPGTLIAVAGSTGHLEISVTLGDARRRTGARIGDTVRVAKDTA